MAASIQSVLMVGSDVIVLERDEHRLPTHPPKPVPPDEFNTRMNVSIALPQTNDVSRLFQPPYAGLNETNAAAESFTLKDVNYAALGELSAKSRADDIRKRSEVASVQTSADIGESPSRNADGLSQNDPMDLEAPTLNAADAQPNRSKKYFWLQDEAEVLVEMVLQFRGDWDLVADKMKKRFGTERRPFYTSVSVRDKFRKIPNAPKRLQTVLSQSSNAGSPQSEQECAVGDRDRRGNDGSERAVADGDGQRFSRFDLSKRSRPVYRWIEKCNPDQGSW